MTTSATLSLDELNAAQRQAVVHTGGPALVLAGAGSGKTRVITYRLVELIRRGIDPERILAVTFTNKAAGELRHRTSALIEKLELRDRFGKLLGAPRWIGTFHSISARLLRRLAPHAGLPSDFVILDEDDQLKICKEICQTLEVSDLMMPPRALRSAIDRAKNQGLLAADYQGHDHFTELVAKLYRAYEERLFQLGAVDFGDLLLKPVVLCDREPEIAGLLSRRFQHVLVDEFQDVNVVQYRLLRHLCLGSRNLFVVGDDDQAIYGWRGADVSLLIDFEQDWPNAQIIKLEENYRSSQLILDAAHAVVSRLEHRHHKRLYTRREGGLPILCHQALDERDEAAFVVQSLRQLIVEEGYDPGDCAVIYRTNAQSRVLEEAMRAVDLPYFVVGGTRFYDRAEIKDVLAYLRLINNPADELALKRVINVPRRGIGEQTVARLEVQARLTGVPLWTVLREVIAGGLDVGLAAAARKRLAGFVDLLEALRAVAADLPLGKLVREVLARTGYLGSLTAADPDDNTRIENVQELVGSIDHLEREATLLAADALPLSDEEIETHNQALNEARPLTLPEYLTRVALQSGEVSGETSGVSLMTAHTAKGLEFRVVLVTGLEDGLFPSMRSDGAGPDEQRARMSEERRLCYVAMTRAKERLILTFASTRSLFGQERRIAKPSQFLRDIPRECLAESVEAEAPSRRTPWRNLHTAAPPSSGPGNRGRWQRPAEPHSVDRGDGQRLVYDGDGMEAGFAAARAGGEEAGEALVNFSRARRRLPKPGAPSHGRSPVAADEREPRIEYDSEHTSIRVGQWVRHGAYGIGRVESVSLGLLAPTVLVRFENGAVKSIQAKYVEPAPPPSSAE